MVRIINTSSLEVSGFGEDREVDGWSWDRPEKQPKRKKKRSGSVITVSESRPHVEAIDGGEVLEEIEF